MEENEIPTACWAVIAPGATDFPEKLSLPVVVKPSAEGSTFGISIVKTMAEWEPALEKAGTFHQPILVETYVKGIEITVGIVDGEAFPPVEIRYPGEMYDYDAKYTHALGETQYLCPPQSIDETIQGRAKEIALRFYRAIQARDMMRVDIIVVPGSGDMIVLEGNNIPGFTASSLLPKAAKQAGISFTRLCAKLISLALARRNTAAS
jgi:D-alanine-D-alanine ligase